MRNAFGVALTGILMVVVQGCTERVMVPPRIDLTQHEVVGVIDFDCDAPGEFGWFLMDRFVEAVRRDQGMVRIVRLGPASEVLGVGDGSRIAPTAFKAVGEKHGVKTIFTGRVTVSDVRPSVSVGHSLTSLGVSADVDATLAVEMVEAQSGASLWSASARDRQHVAGARLFGDKSFTFDADDPENAYARLADNLVYAVTYDFRPTWIRVKKK